MDEGIAGTEAALDMLPVLERTKVKVYINSYKQKVYINSNKMKVDINSQSLKKQNIHGMLFIVNIPYAKEYVQK